MTIFVALLRAVNLGGTSVLSMRDLSQLCEEARFKRVKTYIQSGNVLFESPLPEAKVKAKLEKVLSAKMKKPVSVLVRTGEELDGILRSNPFKSVAPNRLLVLFLDEAPPPNALAGLRIPGREEVKLAGREVFIHYPDGMGRSKLKLPLTQTGTGRNLNTVMKLATMAQAMAAD